MSADKAADVSRALSAVLAERASQDAKWGEQNHDPITWLAILTEEVGEASQDALGWRFGVVGRDEAVQRYRTEMVQVAAVALAMVECIDRDKWAGA